MITYREKPKGYSKKLLELIGKFSKIEEYKVNIQNTSALLYSSKKQLENENSKTVPLTKAQKNHETVGG